MAKNGKAVALVTGASSGIGEAIARRLVEVGYQVFGTSRKAPSSSRFPFQLLQLDVTSDLSVKETVADIIQRSGRLDLLVNNAGFNLAVGGAEENSIQQAKDLFDTNFFGIVRMTPSFLTCDAKKVGESSILVQCWVLWQCPTWPSMQPPNMRSKVIRCPSTTNCGPWGFASQ